MIDSLVAHSGRLERRPGLLAAAKLANVALAMAWGFVVTFVFVRLLPIGEFRAFLVLVAFANFTVSAELGLSSIVYSRLRRARVAGEGDFRNEEISALAWTMMGIVLIGGALLGAAMASGLVETRRPVLFLAFYGVTAVNLLAVLARRTLAALDHNLWWEVLDLVRRLSGIALLLAALGGLPLLDSVLIQLAIALLMLWLGVSTVHRTLGMPAGAWLGVGRGAAHIRRHYLADFSRTGALTLFDVAAYNAPYFTIAAATQDPRPLLLFDFAFKLSRALSATIRALTETALPGLTRAWFARDEAALRGGMRRWLLRSLGMTAAAVIVLLAAGRGLADLLFDGRMIPAWIELGAILVLLCGLAMMCASIYLQNGLGRFGALVPPSFLFLLASLLSVPLALALADRTGWSFAMAFIILYAAVHVALGFVHARMLAGLPREQPT